MILQAILCFRALLSPLSARGRHIGIAEIETISDMILPGDLKFFLHMSAQHFQMIARKRTRNVFTGIQSGDSSLPCQSP